MLKEYIYPTHGNFLKTIPPGEHHKFNPVMVDEQTEINPDLFNINTRDKINQFTKKSKCNRILSRIVILLALRAFSVHTYNRIANLQLILQKDELIRLNFMYQINFNKNKTIYKIPIDITQ